MKESIRTVTNEKGTIPAHTVKAGTVTSDSQKGTYVRGTGTSFLTDFPSYEPNLYLYVVTPEILVKVKEVVNDELLILEDNISVVGNGYGVVVANLKSYTIDSDGAYILDGVAIPVAKEIGGDPEVVRQGGRAGLMDAHKFDVSSTTLRITENR